MASVKLVLRKNKLNKSGMAPVAISYSKDAKTTYLGTGVSISVDHWAKNEVNSIRGIRATKQNEELIQNSKKKDAALNATLKAKLAEVQNAVSRFNLENNRDPDFDELRQVLEGSDKPKVTERKIVLIDDFEKFRLDVKDDLEFNTWRNYIVTKNHLETFLNHTKRPNLALGEFDFSVIDQFKKFLKTDYKFKASGKVKIRAGLSDASLKKNMDRIKKYLKLKVKEQAYSLPLDMKDISVRNIDYSQDEIIYLTADELKAVHELKVKPGGYLDKSRDILLLACSTGLRFGDVMRLEKDRIKENMIHIKTQKNKKLLKIPLFLFAREIFEKYNYNIPKISNQRLNEYVKEVAVLAELNEVIYLDNWRGKKEEAKYFKHQLVSSHTGKKSYIMLHVELGTPIHVLADLTGNTMDSLKHYYRITDELKFQHCANVERAFMKKAV
jgi:integrase